MTTQESLGGISVQSLLRQVECHSYPGCLELRWDRSDMGMPDDGIALRHGSRFVVVAMIKGQMRYFASTENTADEMWDYEIGSFADAANAASFLTEYLVAGHELRDIFGKRKVLRARLEAEESAAIPRLNTDQRDQAALQEVAHGH